MRIRLAVSYVLLSCAVARVSADELAPPARHAKGAGVDPKAVLLEASEIVRKQGEEQHYWCERALLDIGKVQIQAGDFDGALQSIRSSSYEYGRNAGLVDLAEAIAASGQPERAFATLR